MKLQIVGLKYSATSAIVEVKMYGTPSSILNITLPTNKVLTKKELAVTIRDTLNQLEQMGKRMQIVKDMHNQEIEI